MNRRVLRACAVFVVVALGLWLRVRHSGDAGLSMDESGTLWAVRGDAPLAIAERVYAVHGQSPLYYLVVRAATALLGESEATLRLPSILAGALVPLLGFAAVGRAAGARAGALALALLAVDPALVSLSRSARPYALAEAAAAASLAGLAAALVSGSARARLLLWGGAVAAVYAHGLFVALVPALVLGALVARSPAYAARDVRRDAALALGATTPELVHMLRLFLRRGELAWIDHVDPSVFKLLLAEGARGPCAVALLYAAVRALLRGARLRGSADRGMSAALAATVLAVLGGVAGLLLAGTNVVADRYLSPAIVVAPMLAGRLLAVFPRWIAAGALVLAVVLEGPALGTAPGPQEWRGAADYLDELASRSAGPVLLNPGFIEQNLLLRPGGPGPEKSAFIASPFETRPGRADPRRASVLLPRAFGAPGERDYFERAVVPPLAAARSFCIVGRPQYVAVFEEWLRLRFPERSFRRTDAREFTVREFAVPLRVARYEEERR